jgi:peptide deformylase
MDNDLVPEDHHALTTTCTVWDFENPPYNAEELIAHMTQIMRRERGIGLSANQIGITSRLFIVDFDGAIIPCFNPEIAQQSLTLVTVNEGCLSFPDLELKVKRPAWLSVSYQDISGNKVDEILTDIKARCYAHELDHLNGIRFTERVSKLSKDMAMKRRAKNRRN